VAKLAPLVERLTGDAAPAGIVEGLVICTKDG